MTIYICQITFNTFLEAVNFTVHKIYLKKTITLTQRIFIYWVATKEANLRIIFLKTKFIKSE